MAFVIDDIAIAIGLGAASLGTSVVGSVVSRNKQRDAQRAQRRLEARRQQRQQQQQIRETQRLEAQRIAAAAGQGTLGSSGFEGQRGQTVATGAGNVAFQNQMFEGQQVIQNTLASASRRAQNFGIAASVFQLGSMAQRSGLIDLGGAVDSLQGVGATAANNAIPSGNTTSSIFANQLAGGGRVS
jgi:hypothetical protein